MARYDGKMEGGITFSAEEPFVVLGWPSEQDVQQFSTEKSAREFIATACKLDKFAAFARIYEFREDCWKRLSS